MAPGSPSANTFRVGFGSGQLRRLAELVGLARELAGDHHRLGQEELRRLPCEVRTLEDLSAQEVHRQAVLADIARYEYRDADFGRKRDLYRVNLQDHNILASLRRQPAQVGFSPLLLYILTHELVHVIRFIKFVVPFHLGAAERLDEERRVHTITGKILARMPLPGMDQVLKGYLQLSGTG